MKISKINILMFIFGAVVSSFLVASGVAHPNNSAHAERLDIKCVDKKKNIINPDKKIYSKYGITGYFMFTSSNACYNRTQVERSHKMGADTLVTFGSSLKKTTPSSLKSDSTFKKFKINNANGYDYIKQLSGANIKNVFTYSDRLTYGKKALSCGKKRNGVQIIGDEVFTWWLFPTDAAYSACSSPKNSYDLVVSYSPNKMDGNHIIVSNAATYGMKVYLGLPKPQVDPRVPYRADASYTHTLGSFATRVLSTWNERFGKEAAFAGVYQTLETPVFTNQPVWEPNLKVYTILNKVTMYQLPKAKERVLISPYANLKQTAVSRIKPSYSAIVRTGSGVRVILAPQDGVGTGAVGLAKVDTFYTQAKLAGAHEFWANVEAFRPGGVPGKRPNVTKSGLDSQIAKAKKYTNKIISYNWSYMEKNGIAKAVLGSRY